MRQFYFYGWVIREAIGGWSIDNVVGPFDSPEQAKLWILSFEANSDR